MSEFDQAALAALMTKLNPLCTATLEKAAESAFDRKHYEVEIEHWLLKLLDVADSDLSLCVAHFGIDPAELRTRINVLVDRFKTGNSRGDPEVSANLIQVARDAWSLASLDPNSTLIRSGHILLALISTDSLTLGARHVISFLDRIPSAELRKLLPSITSRSAEALIPGSDSGDAVSSSVGLKKGGALEQFTVDLTARARDGKLDPVLGRDAEIRQVIDILMRRRQNNPILTGEAGVGKTAVVEGFALRIAQGDVPDSIKPIVVRTLDLGLLQAGAGVKGEFENRLKSVIEEVKSSPSPIVLFIDEAHTLIGAGGAAGQGDAANLLKPALARGDLRTIAATTWAEYKQYFERDPALTRRFQVIKVEEPDEPTAIAMLRGIVGMLEKHHHVRILDSGVAEAVRLSKRYIPGRQLPDKAVSVLDTACARVAMTQNSSPAEVDDCRRRIELDTTEIRILEREAASGADHGDALERLRGTVLASEQELAALNTRWQAEKELVTRLRELSTTLENPVAEASAPLQREKLQSELRTARAELARLQGEQPLLLVNVDEQAVAQVIANWTGIPVGRMVSNEIQSVLNLKQSMEERIIGQPDALSTIALAMQTSRAKLTDPRKPTGIFLMVGTSGVGKTETALTLADLIYGGAQNLSVINMSEFKEEHKVSTLMGAPPGYAGYGQGGVLTEAVRRRPYSVVLLDEMEKAHPGVQDVFYQVFDKGQLRDSEGRDIDFKNTTIIMTSNAGTDTIAKLAADPETMPDSEGLAEALRPELLKFFKPAFLGRVTVVPYFPLSDGSLRLIIKLQLSRIQQRIASNYRTRFEYSPDVVETIAARCTESESGARNIENVLARGLLPELSMRFLQRLATGQAVTGVRISVDKNGSFSYNDL